MFRKPRLRPVRGPDFSIHDMASIFLGLGISLFLVVVALSHPLALADEAAIIPASEEEQPERALSAVKFLEEMFHWKNEGGEGGEKGASPVLFEPDTLRARLEPSLGSLNREMGTESPAVPATRLVIPALELDAPVVELPITDRSWDVSAIVHEVAHLGGTANPGEKNNMVLAGHITLKRGAGPFLHLERLELGNVAIVYAGEQAYTYRVVDKKQVGPADVSVAYPTSDPILTLITCTDWDAQNRRYTQRVAVIAELLRAQHPSLHR